MLTTNEQIWVVVNLKVTDVMRKDIVTVDENVSVREASQKMREKKIGCVIAFRKGVPIGMITERDVTWNVAGEGLNASNVKVSEIMSTPLVTVDPDADLIEAAKLMQQNEMKRLAVSKKNTLYGVLSAIDIAGNLESYVEEDTRSILKYAFFMPFH